MSELSAQMVGKAMSVSGKVKKHMSLARLAGAALTCLATTAPEVLAATSPLKNYDTSHTKLESDTGLKDATFKGDPIGWLSQKISEWTPVIIGTAFIVLSLKIVITAVARFFDGSSGGRGGSRGGGAGAPGGGGRGGQGESFLYHIPLIGAYPSNMSWLDIFKNVGFNLAIVLGFWIILGLIVGLINYFLGQAGGPSSGGNA